MIRLLLFLFGILLGLAGGILSTPECHCTTTSAGLAAWQWEFAKDLGRSEVAEKTRLECNELLARREKGLRY